MFVKSCTSSSRPLRRIVRSSSTPVRLPTGTDRFCCCNAATTSPTLMSLACSAAGFRSTIISRFTPPTTSTFATPAIERNSRVTPGSASNVSCGAVSSFDDMASCTTGRSVGLNFCRIGSFISAGRSLRLRLIASRISVVASCMFLPNWKNVTMVAKPSRASPCTLSTPEIPVIASSTRSRISRST